MMNCFFAKNHLFSYMEGNLASFHAEDLKLHLESCVSCKRVHEELMIVRLSFKGIPPVEVTGRLRLQVRTFLHKHKSRQAWYSRSILSPEALSFLSLLGLMGVVLGMFFSSKNPPRLRPESAAAPVASEAPAVAALPTPRGSTEIPAAGEARPVAASNSTIPQTPGVASTAAAISAATEPYKNLDISIVLKMETALLQKSEGGIRALCGQLRCRSVDPAKSMRFVEDSSGAKFMRVQIPAKNYLVMRSQVGKWGSLKDAVIAVPRQGTAETGSTAGTAIPASPKVSFETLNLFDQAPVILEISIIQGALDSGGPLENTDATTAPAAADGEPPAPSSETAQ